MKNRKQVVYSIFGTFLLCHFYHDSMAFWMAVYTFLFVHSKKLKLIYFFLFCFFVLLLSNNYSNHCI